MLAEHDPKRAIGEGHVGDVRPADGDLIVKSDKAIEPTGGFAVLLGQVDRRDRAAAPVGDVARGTADPAAGVEYLVLAGDPGEVHQLAGGDATHGVEVLEHPEVGGLEPVEILSGRNEGPLDVGPR